MVVSEMVASAEFCNEDAESSQRASGTGLETPVVQLAGREAYWMGEAAKRAEAGGTAIIDINMGCPAKKVTGGYSGSALMRNLDHALTLVDATVAAVSVPVTLKMRLGWDNGTINAPELAARAQSAGVQMITVHGRTRCQFYDGKADWDAVRRVKDAITIPLVINGDISDGTSAREALDRSGADAVMVGRASYGRPWLAGMIAARAAGLVGSMPGNIGEYVITHYEAMLSLYGSATGVRHARKHLGWYLDAHVWALQKPLRQEVMTQTEPRAVIALLKQAFSGEWQTTMTEKLAA